MDKFYRIQQIREFFLEIVRKKKKTSETLDIEIYLRCVLRT